jgi:hypothetical protein
MIQYPRSQLEVWRQEGGGNSDQNSKVQRSKFTLTRIEQLPECSTSFRRRAEPKVPHI